MGIRTATRSQLLMTLRRWMPTMSLRRLGDVLDGAKLVTIEGNSESTATAAFGLVLEGMLHVAVEGENSRWVGPGEIFGMTTYRFSGKDSAMSLSARTQTVRYLAFSQSELTTLSFIRRPGSPV